MNVQSEKNKSTIHIKLITLILFLFGVGFIVASIFSYKHIKNLIDHGETTTAIIVSIKEESDGEQTKYEVLVEYELNGTKYTNELHSYKTGMKKGQLINIRYLSSNPNDIIHAENDFALPWMLLLFGIVSLYIALLIFILNALNRKHQPEDCIDRNSFVAFNSKFQVLFFVIPIIFIFPLFFDIYDFQLQKTELIFSYIALTIFEIFLIIIIAHFYFVPKIAIEIENDSIIFHKRKKIYLYPVQDIKLVKINMNWGSFDVRIYTHLNQKKTFHYLIQNSTLMKLNFSKYFETRNVEVQDMYIT